MTPNDIRELAGRFRPIFFEIDGHTNTSDPAPNVTNALHIIAEVIERANAHVKKEGNMAQFILSACDLKESLMRLDALKP
jgi:hypothetical protein